MKKIAILLLMILLTFICQSQIKYDVHVFNEDANKTTLSNVDNHLSTYNRSITENIISFYSNINYSTVYIDSIFDICGIQTLITIKNKSSLIFKEDKVGGNNCENAEILCSGGNINGFSGGFGNQELNNSNNGCLGLEHQSSWYYVNIQTSGDLLFTINPNNPTDYDFAVWGPFTATTANANCPPVNNPIRCSFAGTNGNTGLNGSAGNSEGAGGNGFVNLINANVGDIYIILIDHFNNSNIGYNLSFGSGPGTATLGCTPVVLPVELTYFEGEKIGNINHLIWETESEHNNSYFELEYTADPINNLWESITKMDGQIDSEDKNKYEFNHISYPNKINYYRLTQVDTDGTKKIYKNLVAIDNRLKDKNPIKIINLLGQEVKEDSPGILIYLYNDGTTVKVFNK